MQGKCAEANEAVQRAAQASGKVPGQSRRLRQQVIAAWRNLHGDTRCWRRQQQYDADACCLRWCPAQQQSSHLLAD
jgi:predicted alpha-1,6-mannanase (GH76 family)